MAPSIIIASLHSEPYLRDCMVEGHSEGEGEGGGEGVGGSEAETASMGS